MTVSMASWAWMVGQLLLHAGLRSSLQRDDSTRMAKPWQSWPWQDSDQYTQVAYCRWASTWLQVVKTMAEIVGMVASGIVDVGGGFAKHLQYFDRSRHFAGNSISHTRSVHKGKREKPLACTVIRHSPLMFVVSKSPFMMHHFGMIQVF